VAAGVASSMAQSSNVYSLNIVGYVNIPINVGYNLITLPLQNADPTSSINSVLTNTSIGGVSAPAPGNTAVFTWDPVHSHFNQPEYAGGDGNWYDQTFSVLETNGLPPGQAFFLQMPTVANGGVTNMTVTVVGSVLTGTNSYTVTQGYNFYGNFEPIQGDITTNGFPVVDNSALFTWAGNHYNQPVYGLGTNDSSYSGTNIVGNPASVPVFADQTFSYVVVVAPPVGVGFLYQYLGTATSWTQTFSVGQ